MSFTLTTSRSSRLQLPESRGLTRLTNIDNAILVAQGFTSYTGRPQVVLAQNYLPILSFSNLVSHFFHLISLRKRRSLVPDAFP
jgi:hypothetical protein